MQEHANVIEQTLLGKTIAVPETRELDVFAAMLERRGAQVVRCPLVAILDSPMPDVVLTWIRAFIAGSCDDLILLTGEGVRRMFSCIEQHESSLREPFVARLAITRKIVRGPKPARALREIGLRAEIEAIAPTTDGVIETLQAMDLVDRRIGVQLYGSDPNLKLVEFLRSAGAVVNVVAPYVYADKSADGVVMDVLARMQRGEIDVIAFTSKAQVDRLLSVASRDVIDAALARTQIAAVGPVVADVLTNLGFNVEFMPEQQFFMKPLVRSIEEKLAVSSS